MNDKKKLEGALKLIISSIVLQMIQSIIIGLEALDPIKLIFNYISMGIGIAYFICFIVGMIRLAKINGSFKFVFILLIIDCVMSITGVTISQIALFKTNDTLTKIGELMDLFLSYITIVEAIFMITGIRMVLSDNEKIVKKANGLLIAYVLLIGISNTMKVFNTNQSTLITTLLLIGYLVCTIVANVGYFFFIFKARKACK